MWGKDAYGKSAGPDRSSPPPQRAGLQGRLQLGALFFLCTRMLHFSLQIGIRFSIFYLTNIIITAYALSSVWLKNANGTNLSAKNLILGYNMNIRKR